jgi:hypothetical protein
MDISESAFNKYKETWELEMQIWSTILKLTSNRKPLMGLSSSKAKYLKQL